MSIGKPSRLKNDSVGCQKKVCKRIKILILETWFQHEGKRGQPTDMLYKKSIDISARL